MCRLAPVFLVKTFRPDFSNEVAGCAQTKFGVHSFYSHTVGCHLSELQLSKYVGYLNTFSKATPTISGYFRGVSGLILPVVWQLKTQDNFYGQSRLRNKGESNCQTHPLGTASLQQNGNQATAYGCAHSSDYYIHSVR